MEPDRYKHNNKLYICGIICLILALSFFFFSLYIIPFLVWHLHYEVPETITILVTYFEQQYRFSSGEASVLVWLIFFIPGLIAGYIAYYISNHIDNQIHKLDIIDEEPQKAPAQTQITREMKESAGLAFKIIFLMIMIVVIIFLLELLVQI